MLSLNTSQICGNWCSLNWLSTIYANKSFHLYHKTYRDQENCFLLLLILVLATEVDWADKISYTNGLPSPFLLTLLLFCLPYSRVYVSCDITWLVVLFCLPYSTVYVSCDMTWLVCTISTENTRLYRTQHQFSVLWKHTVTQYSLHN